ncbi:DUF1801 domain-containing protein [Candidatus Parcubacteria bacterium]|nr:MAG: DUF1801 domain-containing protein [Candidatus Parcubacteria bacterium]
MNKDIQTYNRAQSPANKTICEKLCKEIIAGLPKAESKIWHRSPVWFIEGNPIVGYNVQKKGVQLLFWSGVSFKEKELSRVGSEKFKTAGVIFTNAEKISAKDIKRWLRKSKKIQWDYKNIVKRRGMLIRL